MKCPYHCFSTRNKSKIKIDFRCLNLNAQHRVPLLYDEYMENHAMLELSDKHVLFLEYSSPSHTGEILLPFLDHN